MSQPILRTAIIGTGRIAATYDDEVIDRRPPSYYTGPNRHSGAYTILPTNHAHSIQTVPGYALIAAANRTPQKLQDFGERYAVQALYTDFRLLLANEQPDVVSVCTQSPEKAEIVIAAAEAGVRAIVVEKAFATSMAEVDAMLEACRRHNVFLAVNHPNRFSPMMRAVKAHIEKDDIGPITSVTAHASGGMLHIGTHIFDLIRFWAGEAVEIYAHMPEFSTDADLPARGMLSFANGATGFFDHTHKAQQSVEVRGPKGFLTASSALGDGWFFGYTPTQPPESRRQYPNRLTAAPIEGDAHTQSLTQRMYAELRTTLTTGAPFVSTGEDGARALELCLACYQSHQAGGPIRLPLADRTLSIPNR